MDIQQRKIVLLSIGGGVLGIVLVVLATSFNSFLGARVAPGLAFQIHGPETLTPGASVTVTWDTNPENVRRFPYEKIEVCRGRSFGEDCTTLSDSTPNDGEERVTVPATVKSGSGVLRLTARDPNGTLLSRFTLTRPVAIARGTLLRPGQRVTVRWKPDTRYAKAKIEFCALQDVAKKCVTLAHVVANSGRSSALAVPRNVPRGRGSIRVIPRDEAGQLVRTPDASGAAYVEQATLSVRVVKTSSQDREQKSSEGSDGGAGGSSGSGGEGEGNKSTQSSQPADDDQRVPRAEFVTPRDGHSVRQGNPLPTQVRLVYTSGDDPVCQEWKLDGVIIARSMWRNNQSPDDSDGPCGSTTVVPQPPFLDVNGDGSVTEDDFNLLRAYLNGENPNVTRTGAQQQNQTNPFDVNADGVITPTGDLLILINALNNRNS